MATYHLLLAYVLFSCKALVFSLQYTATNKPLRDCPKRCGTMDITYPFGTKEGCYLDETFEVTCNSAPPNSANLPWFEFDTNFISVPDHLLRATGVGSLSLSFNKSSGESSFGHSINTSLIIENFMVSNSRNKIVTIGCDFYAYVVNSDTREFVGGCASLCNRTDIITSVTPSCSDLGCCQTNLPENLNNITVWVETINTMKRSWADHCGFFGIVDKDYYSLDQNKLTNCNDTNDIPTMMEWVVGNTSCQHARKRKDYACGHNTNCLNNSRGVGGYRCACQNGYKGNPYLLDGCKDIDECKRPEGNRCPPSSSCFNTQGSYYCVPNKKSSSVFPIILGTSLATGILILVAACFWSHRKFKKIKDQKLKHKFFKRNGGLLLQKQISSCLGNVAPELKLYKIEELEKATDNFNECRVLGKGGLGTVYKGMLSDGCIVAVKIANVIDESQVGQFINEVLILSQIKHRHIIKLLGCCLETQVPRLAYEYVSNGTLHHHLHEVSDPKISWENRLRIAAEVAGALAYLHSYALTAIIHRDVKSSNILLDENYRAIVSDFGLSRSVSIDKTHLTTFVGGTFGYLDPEYFRTGQLNDKSDVYAFGDILAELLTGQKPVSSKQDEEGLVFRFQTALKENCLIEILDKLVADEGQEEEIYAVAELCKKCLKLNSRRRPCTKDLAAELDQLRRTKEKRQNRESFQYEFSSKRERCYSRDVSDSESEDDPLLSYVSK